MNEVGAAGLVLLLWPNNIAMFQMLKIWISIGKILNIAFAVCFIRDWGQAVTAGQAPKMIVPMMIEAKFCWWGYCRIAYFLTKKESLIRYW